MATEQELQTSLDSIKATLSGEDGVISTLTTGIQGLHQQITDLQTKVASGSSVTQAELDTLAAQAESVSTKAASQVQSLQALANPTPPAP